MFTDQVRSQRRSRDQFCEAAQHTGSVKSQLSAKFNFKY
jgi:hypothetical protein